MDKRNLRISYYDRKEFNQIEFYNIKLVTPKIVQCQPKQNKQQLNGSKLYVDIIEKIYYLNACYCL